MRKIDSIIVHCTATRADFMKNASNDDRIDEIRRWHVEDRGWSDIGYNYLIQRDGVINLGRDLDGDGNVDEEVGAHARGYNSHSIGISLFGGYASSADDQFSENFTPEQDAALRSLISDLRKKYGDLKIMGHNEISNKACPGFNAMEWYTGEVA